MTSSNSYVARSSQAKISQYNSEGYLSMKTETAGKIKYGVWSLIGGAVIAMIIGFAWGGWSTAATTQKISEEAVLASHAAICVAQFMNEPNHEEKLKELGEVSSY